MNAVLHLLRAAGGLLGGLVIAPLLLFWSLLLLAFTDLAWLLFGRRRLTPETKPNVRAASVVIPNWNGRDLLERYLPSVIAAMNGNPDNEVIVVDNGSEDGSAEYLRQNFPQVRLLALETNLGFGGGSNAGFRAAKNDIVVLLNSDMRVEPDFLAPLLEPFSDEKVFAVSCQIYLSDPLKRREETGLTEGWWEAGKPRVSHREDAAVNEPFPCFYAGGGSSAFDRRKFLELGGFDELLSPFYLEDTDLGFLAWKHGWKVLYHPRSIVFHEHRGTIGRKFTQAYINSVLKKNFLLFTWKNIHGWGRLLSHAFAAWGGAILSGGGDERIGRANLAGIWRATLQSFEAAGARWRARSLSVVDDTEAFLRSRPSHFHDRFGSPSEGPLNVLFVSPYPILPPVHGGAVFMLETLRELSRHVRVHAVVLLDRADQLEANAPLAEMCASLETAVRPNNHSFLSLSPHAVEEFYSRDVQWVIDRSILLRRIDMVQIEYTPMGRYAGGFKRIGSAIFEHDVYFQSVGRLAGKIEDPLARAKAWFEYFRALRFEPSMLARYDHVQVCTRQNRDYLVSFVPELGDRIHSGLRACIDTRGYIYPRGPVERDTILFIGSARHEPNRAGVDWFVRYVLPSIIARRPNVRFDLVGFDAQLCPDYAHHPNIRMLGTVANVKPLLATRAITACPILSGSGVRVKLLEAFAAGTPAVSTRIGCEGLADKDGEFCAIADEPAEFADRVWQLLEHPDQGDAMAQRARREVEENWDSERVTTRLVSSYAEIYSRKNPGLTLRDRTPKAASLS
jgi:GT2 family glycosyltransferase/glycosyltransferase involved in cell wall biosynthesis